MSTPKKPDLARRSLDERGGGRGKPLSYAQISLILQLNQQDKPQTEIATIVGTTQQTISRILREFTDTTAIARLRLKGAAELMAERVCEAAKVASARGDASPALEILDRSGAFPRIRDGEKAAGPRVVVVVGNVTPPQITIDSEPIPLPTSTPVVD